MPIDPQEAERVVFAGLRALRQGWPMGGFSWDSRLNSVASSFPIHLEPRARAAATEGLPTVWGPADLKKAPPRIQSLAEHYGGVRSGQLLLTAGYPDGLLAFGLWWPWGTSETISLRVGLADVDAARSQHARFRDIFGVTL